MKIFSAKVLFRTLGCVCTLIAANWGLLATEDTQPKAEDYRISILVENQIQQITVALILYDGTSGRPPTTEQGLDALIKKPVKEPIPTRWARWLDDPLVDPWGHPYHYRFPATKSKKPYDIWSAGPDGVDGTADDIGNW